MRSLVRSRSESTCLLCMGSKGTGGTTLHINLTILRNKTSLALHALRAYVVNNYFHILKAPGT